MTSATSGPKHSGLASLMLATLLLFATGGSAAILLTSSSPPAHSIPLPPAGPPPPARHVVMVVLDTVRADHLSLYGHDRPTTPYLEDLSREALRFRRVSSTAPWTVPSHASMFTGLWPSTHGAQWGHLSLAERFTTLAEVLDEAGFCTAGLSANQLVGENTGLDQGFDEFEQFPGTWSTRTDRLLARFTEVLDESLASGERLFLFVNLMDAHIPYNYGPHRRDFGIDFVPPVRTVRAKWEINAGAREFTDEEKEQHRLAYDSAIRRLDDAVRDMVELLLEHEILDETLLIITSDHGEGLGYHPQIGHSISVWEEQLRVPLMVRFPGVHRGGDVVEDHTSLIGMMPSILDWTGVPRPEALRGAPDLEEAARFPVVADYRSYFSETNRGINVRLSEIFPRLAEQTLHSHVLYCDEHKLVVDAGGRTAFYNLEGDPHEQNDLGREMSPELSRCLEVYRDLLSEGLFTDFSQEPGSDEDEERLQEQLEALRALGYVQ